MFRLYYASAIDTCQEEAFKQIVEYKKLFAKFALTLEVYGAGFNESPIIRVDSPPTKKGVVCAYDLRLIRQCDIFLMVTDLKTYASKIINNINKLEELETTLREIIE